MKLARRICEAWATTFVLLFSFVLWLGIVGFRKLRRV